MKQIAPIQSWVKGKSVTATIFNLRPIGGTLFVDSKFYYALLDENLALCAEGNIDMTGESYQSWGNNDEYAYTWASLPDVLNLTITGDYVAPVPVVKETNAQPTDSILADLRKDAPIDNLEIQSK